MRAPLTQLTLFLVASLTCKGAYAQPSEEQPIDDLDLVKLLNVQVSTATKTSESLDEAPAVITVVTQEDIHNWGYRNVGEVLNHCVGFFAVDDHIQPNIGVRGVTGGLGAESGIIKVMIDGRSVVYRTTSGNWLGAELVPMESIKQIEIIRGPASALYGADAFLGVVNIITVLPDEARPVAARLFVGVTGTNPSGQLDVVGNGKTGRVDYMLGVVGEYGSRSGLELPDESQNPNIPAYAGNRRTADNLDRRSLGVQARVGYRVPETGQVVASAYLNGFGRGGDFAPWAQLTNGEDSTGKRTGTTVSLGQGRFNLDALLHTTKTLDLSWQGTYFRGDILPADRVELGSDIWYAERKTSYQGFDSVLEARFIPSNRYNLVAGVEGVYDRELFQAPERIVRETSNSVPTTGSQRHTERFVNVGAYVSSNITVIEQWLKLTGGLRYDQHNIYGSQVTGRLGATSRLSRSVVMKLLYGSAFKAPSPYLLYATPLGPGDVVGNEELKPQKIHTVEYQLSFKPNSFFGITSGVSYSRLLDKAEFSPQGINQVARNSSRQTTISWETRAELKHYEDYSTYAAFELVSSRRSLDDDGYVAKLIGDANVVYPPYIFRLGAMAALPSVPTVPLSAGAEGMLVGPRHAADASVLAAAKRYDLKTYATMNLFLTTRSLYLIPRHESVASLRVYNVLGTRGPDPGYSGFEYPLSPREVMLEFRHTY